MTGGRKAFNTASTTLQKKRLTADLKKPSMICLCTKQEVVETRDFSEASG